MNRVIPVLIVAIISILLSCKREDIESTSSYAVKVKEPLALEGKLSVKLIRSDSITYSRETLQNIFKLPSLSKVQIDSSERYTYSISITTNTDSLERYKLTEEVLEKALRKALITDENPNNTLTFPKRSSQTKYRRNYLYINSTMHSATPYRTGRRALQPDKNSISLVNKLEQTKLSLLIKEELKIKDIAKVSAYEAYRYSRRKRNFDYSIECHYKGENLHEDIITIKERLQTIPASYYIYVFDSSGTAVIR